MSIKINFLIIIVILQLIKLSVTEKPYQVTLWLKTDYYKMPIGKPLCNGIIIHERLILTVATCLCNKTITSNINNNSDTTAAVSDTEDNDNIINTANLTKPAIIELTTTESSSSLTSSSSAINLIKCIVINASEIVITGGNNIDIQKEKRIITNITEIEIAQNFNITTLENDIALLRLNESLPLSSRRDIQWISLDDHTAYRNTSCKISFSNFMAKNTQETHTIKLLMNQNCTNTTSFQSPRKTDVCSLYVNPSICDLSSNDLIVNNDRGTGLVCDSKLIGVLSQIIPNDNNTKCSNVEPIKAIYTRVAIHLNWIYEKIAIESMADLGKSNYISAPQYKESAPSPSIQMPHETQLLETSSIRSETTTRNLYSSSTSNQMNRTEMNENVNNKPTVTQNESKKHSAGSFGVLTKSISFQLLSISIIIILVFNY